MRKNAFTLIELLAVIVLLAIIALIAVPIVLNIISDTKKSSVERNAGLYLKSVELAIAKENLKEKFDPDVCQVQKNGNIICNEKEIVIDMKGEKPTSGSIKIVNGKIDKSLNLKYKDSKISKIDGEIKELNEEEILENLFDLSNTKWQFNDTISNYEFLSEYAEIEHAGISYYPIKEFDSSIKSGEYEYDILSLFQEEIYGINILGTIYPLTEEFLEKYNRGDTIAYVPQNSLGLPQGWCWGNYNAVENIIPIDAPIIEIHDGNAVTEEQLINWLKENASFLGMLEN